MEEAKSAKPREMLLFKADNVLESEMIKREENKTNAAAGKKSNLKTYPKSHPKSAKNTGSTTSKR